MLRSAYRLCRMLPGERVTRWRFFTSAKSEQPLSTQLKDADVEEIKRAADDARLFAYDRRSKAMATRTKSLTKEPFVKNLFLGKFDTVRVFFTSLLLLHYFIIFVVIMLIMEVPINQCREFQDIT